MANGDELTGRYGHLGGNHPRMRDLTRERRLAPGRAAAEHAMHAPFGEAVLGDTTLVREDRGHGGARGCWATQLGSLSMLWAPRRIRAGAGPVRTSDAGPAQS
jgi:hypothetical protein